jgi:glycosyltransferase involved in cell wall biosynthesis
MPRLVDVLVPAFNAAATIADTIASLKAQTLKDIRLVVLDDGSTDATLALAQECARNDLRLEVHSTANGGIVAARNRLLELASAEFIAWHDADDIALPRRLEAQLAHLKSHPDCVGVGTQSWHIDAQGRRTGYRTRMDLDVRDDPHGIPAREPWIGPFVMARTQVVKSLGGYREATYAEDSDLYWRMAEVGALHNLPEALAEYRVHGASVSSASVVSGRISACNSQRAALNAARRRRGDPDLGFDAGEQAALRGADGLPAMVEVGASGMNSDERKHYRLSVAAKLLQLASYRPYVLDKQDLQFISSHLFRNVLAMSPQEFAMNIGYRLLYKNVKRRRFRDMATLLAPSNMLRSHAQPGDGRARTK